MTDEIHRGFLGCKICPKCGWFHFEGDACPKKEKEGEMDRQHAPEIVCICGSTRFADQHAIARWELERDGGHICLMINYLPSWYAKQQGWNGHDHLGEASGTKEILDELHKRKIDLCDWVLVVNCGGYIGDSTRGEIKYAESLGKRVRYLET